MERLPFRLLMSITLIVLIAVPVAVSAQTLAKVYADSTRAVGTGDGTPRNPLGIGSPPNFADAIAKVTKPGTIVYIFSGGWCELPVTANGDVDAPTNCSPGVPPETGFPVATGLLWVLAGVVAVALVVVGFFVRRRSARS